MTVQHISLLKKGLQKMQKDFYFK